VVCAAFMDGCAVKTIESDLRTAPKCRGNARPRSAPAKDFAVGSLR
jgi:hypothetical protein